MKYNARQTRTGEWAVFTGEKCFSSTKTTDEQKANEQAIIRSIQWHNDKIQSLFNKLENLNPEKYGSYGEDVTTLGDLLC